MRITAVSRLINHTIEGSYNGMKLEGTQSGTIWATKGRKLYKSNNANRFEYVSTLPNPGDFISKIHHEFITGHRLEWLSELISGRIHCVNVWPLDEHLIVANVYRWLFVSTDGGDTWEHSFELPESSGIRGLMPCALCYHDGSIYFGEYIFDEEKAPRIMRSDDSGKSWHTELSLENVRHFHSIQVDPYTDEIWITTGDRDNESCIGRIQGDELEIVGSGDQMWRAVQPVFLRDSIIWGTDAPYQQNHVLKLPRNQISKQKPDPEVLFTETNPFYFGANVGDWIAFSTSSSMKEDSTAPSGQVKTSDKRVAIYSATKTTGYREWNLLREYQPRVTLTRLLGLNSWAANHYAFLDGCSTTGELLAGPFNCNVTDPEVISTEHQIYTTLSVN